MIRKIKNQKKLKLLKIIITAVQEEVQITENGENPTNRQTINVKPAKKPAQPKHLPQAAVPQKPHQEEVSHSGKTQHETTSTTGRPQRRAKQKFLDNLKIINKQQKRRRKQKSAPKKTAKSLNREEEYNPSVEMLLDDSSSSSFEDQEFDVGKRRKLRKSRKRNNQVESGGCQQVEGGNQVLGGNQVSGEKVVRRELRRYPKNRSTNAKRLTSIQSSSSSSPQEIISLLDTSDDDQMQVDGSKNSKKTPQKTPTINNHFPIHTVQFAKLLTQKDRTTQ